MAADASGPAYRWGGRHPTARTRAEHSRAARNLDRLTAFAAAAAVLAGDPATAAAYGKVKAILRAQGTPIPENDIWIAALARQHPLRLVSRDAHFSVIPGLDLVRWEDDPRPQGAR